MQAVVEGDIVDFAEIGHSGLIVNISSIIFSTASEALLFAGKIEGANKVEVLMAEFEGFEDG